LNPSIQLPFSPIQFTRSKTTPTVAITSWYNLPFQVLRRTTLHSTTAMSPVEQQRSKSGQTIQCQWKRLTLRVMIRMHCSFSFGSPT
jgi:hypothetical protein